jgi:hypothetical protein
MVYEMENNGIKVRRRIEDGRVHINQLVLAAGVTRSKTRRILSISGIPTVGGKYGGTWVEIEKARDICETFEVAEVFQPLFKSDLGQLKRMVGGKLLSEEVLESQSDSVELHRTPPAIDIDGLIKQAQSQRHQLQIPRSAKLDIGTVKRRYQCRLSTTCTEQFMKGNQLKV